MRLPGADWFSPANAVRFIVNGTGESSDRVIEALQAAGRGGDITATGCRRGLYTLRHPNLMDRERVPAEEWSRLIDWRRSQIGRYESVRIDRTEIERWLATATDQAGNEAKVRETQVADALPEQAVHRKTMEAAAREYITAAYPEGVPAGKTNKILAVEYREAKKAAMSERTMRRARRRGPTKAKS